MPTSGTKFLTSACLAVVVAALLIGGWIKLSRPAAVRNAESLLQTDRFDAAATTLDEYLRRHPADPAALRVRFYLHLKTEQYPEALATYRQLADGKAALVAALTHRNVTIRGNAARFICEQDLPVDSATLIAALNDSAPTVRRYCAQLLGQRRDASALKPLFQLLGDDNWYVRATSAAALGQIGDPRAAGWLLQLLNESDALVQLDATLALRQVAADSNQELLRQAFVNAPPAKQLAIAIALAKLHDPLAYAPLTNAITTADTTTRRQIAIALGDFSATNSLQRLAQDKDPGVREAALQSLQEASEVKP